MELQREFPQIDNKFLTSLVQQIVQDGTAEIVSWQAEEVQGGTLGEVYILTGLARSEGQNMDLPWSLVLKIQRPYSRLGDPESWRREMYVYQSDILADLPASLRTPRCLSVSEPNSEEIWLWLEKVEGINGTRMGFTDYVLAARHLAHYQGQFLVGRPLPSHPWLSTRYWVVKTVADWGTGAIPWLRQLQNLPEAERPLPADVIEGTLHLWVERDRLLDVLNSLPQTHCHRDFFSGNVFVHNDSAGVGHTSVIDWDCSGVGMIGEDIADLVGEALVFDDFPLDRAEELKAAVFESYHQGLREAGWSGDQKLLELGYSIGMVLQWCFRIICRARRAEDRVVIERYIAILRFMLQVANDTYNILK